MKHYCVAYRHENGEIEGFAATRFDAARAKEAAMKCMRAEIEAKGLTFNPDRIVESSKGLSAAERVTLQRDWRIVHA